MGGFFLAEVKARRGQALKSGVDIGTGEVWPGPEAKELGLVDGVATVDDFVATHWGMKTYDYGPSADSSPFLTRSLQDAIAGAVRRLALSGPAVQ